MFQNDVIGIGLYLGFIAAIGLPVILFKVCCNPPFEIARKLYHLIITLSIFPLVTFFEAWYMAVLAAFSLVLLGYPALALAERAAFYKRVMVERQGGEFRSSLIIVQLSMSILIFIFWGLLGEEWKYIAVVAVMAWGLGDAAAALVGKTFGRRRIIHPLIQGAKTYEGTLAMFVVAGMAIFLTMLIYAGQSWQVSMLAAILVAPAGAIVELFSNRGMDTMTVPLAVAFLVTILMSSLAFLGV